MGIEYKRTVQQTKIAFFFKQWGTWGEDNKKRSNAATVLFPIAEGPDSPPTIAQ